MLLNVNIGMLLMLRDIDQSFGYGMVLDLLLGT